MKTTLGVALTPPTAAALIAGACVLAAAFLPTDRACAPHLLGPGGMVAAPAAHAPRALDRPAGKPAAVAGKAIDDDATPPRPARAANQAAQVAPAAEAGKNPRSQR